MIIYFFKVMLCSGLFYGLYYLLLQREKMLVFNRFYLLACVVLAFLIPIIPIKQVLPGKNVLDASVNVMHGKVVSVVPEVIISKNRTVEINVHPTRGNAITVSDILLSIYFLITVCLITRLFVNLFYFVSQTKNSRSADYKGVKIIYSEKAILPYSFLNFIFINKSHFCDMQIRNEILEHEMAHVKQGHSWDIIFIELVIAFFWFNPFLFLIKKSIKINHEYLADSNVISKGYSIAEYGSIIVHLLQKCHNPYLSSGFNFLTLSCPEIS